MNKTYDSMSASEPASAVPTIKELRRTIEKIWADTVEVQREAFLLVNDIENCLDPGRGRVVDTTVTLMFQKRGLDTTTWLAGKVWGHADNIEVKLFEVLLSLDAILEGSAS